METSIKEAGGRVTQHILNKTSALKVYAHLDLISTKLPIVKDLIEINIHASTDELEQYEDGSR